MGIFLIVIKNILIISTVSKQIIISSRRIAFLRVSLLHC